MSGDGKEGGIVAYENELAVAPPREGEGEAGAVLKAIRRIAHEFDSRSKLVARACGLTIPQIVVLQGVRDLGEVTARTLSDYADVSEGTLVQILTKLEANGLVERQRSPNDRRVVHTRLTPRGKAMLAGAPALLHEAFAESFARLAPDERATIAASFRKVVAMVAGPS
ncbi:MAG: MarR family transcriptional regulator [Alphaproteobacteria bacterium]|nr:MarR family transcriptional regulator [Alphaproteobacteria bacterium]